MEDAVMLKWRRIIRATLVLSAGAVMIVIAVISVWFNYMVVVTYNEQVRETERSITELATVITAENQKLQQTVEELRCEVDSLRDEVEQVKGVYEEFLERFQIDTVELTGYAPLDPNAVEGMCYSGDPNVTASGERLVVGETVAAGPGVPFGTVVYIEGYGRRVVQDRGGSISNRHLDIAVASRGEALRIGREECYVLWLKEDD